jgi:hypothetical protein
MKDVQNVHLMDREATKKQRRTTMKINNRWVMLGAIGVMSLGTMVGPLTSEAQAQKGRRNTAIGAGAATVYGALRGNRTMTVVGGLGTAYAYKRYRDAKRSNRPQTVRQVFGNTPVYDSRGNRYGQNTRFVPNRTYYNARGRAIG